MRADIQFKRPELSLKEVITAPVEPLTLQMLQYAPVIVAPWSPRALGGAGTSVLEVFWHQLCKRLRTVWEYRRTMEPLLIFSPSCWVFLSSCPGRRRR